MDIASFDRASAGPGADCQSGVVRVGTQCRGVGERDEQMAAGFDDAVDLSDHAVEVFDVTQRGHRDCQVDLVGGQEGQFSELGLMELDGGFVVYRQLPRGPQLLDVFVDCGYPRASQREPDRSVSLAASQF